MKISNRIIVLITSMFLLLGSASYAGGNCEQKETDPKVLADAMHQAVKMKKALDQSNADLAIISRVGSDISKYHLYYTHAAFVTRKFPGREGEWTVVHLLNQCGTANSSIYSQGLTNFFMDNLFTMDFQVSIPNEKTQAGILKVLSSSKKLSLHDSHYNMLAYPFSTQYQNSNQWVLEVIASALSGANSRAAAQNTLKETGFEPSYIKVSPFTKLGAQVFKANISFEDHPQMEKRENRYSIISVDSVINYLNQQNRLLSNREYKG